MIAVLKEPGKPARKIEINNSLKDLQKAVEGFIECVHPFDDNVALVVNEEGKLRHLSPNFALATGDKVSDIVVGPCLIVGVDEEDFSSLDDALIEKYIAIFNKPSAKCLLGTQVLPVVFTTA